MLHKSFRDPGFVKKNANLRFGIAGTPAQVYEHLCGALADLNCHPQCKPGDVIKGTLFMPGVYFRGRWVA